MLTFAMGHLDGDIFQVIKKCKDIHGQKMVKETYIDDKLS